MSKLEVSLARLTLTWRQSSEEKSIDIYLIFYDVWKLFQEIKLLFPFLSLKREKSVLLVKMYISLMK